MRRLRRNLAALDNEPLFCYFPSAQQEFGMQLSATFDLNWILDDLNATIVQGITPVNFENLAEVLRDCDPKETVVVRLGFEKGRKPKEWTYEAGERLVIQTMQTGKSDPTELKPGQIVRCYGVVIRHVMETQRPKLLCIEVDPRLNGSLVGRAIMVALMEPTLFIHPMNDEPYRGPERVVLYHNAPDSNETILFEEAVRQGVWLGRYANAMRRLTAYPLNVLNMERFVQVAYELFRDDETRFEDLDEDHVSQMGLLQAVCAGSGRLPYVVQVRVDPLEGPTKEVDVDIFKCLVFDDGGPNHKGTAHIDKMQTDMGAGAMGLMKFHWLARHPELLKRSTVGLFMIAENRIGSQSYMHGDVLVAYDGRRVEVHNTDAEGRLVLADGIAYARATYDKIRRLTTNATLTGAVIAALGDERSGLMVRGNNRKMFDVFEDVGEAQGDLVHRLIIDRADHIWMKGVMADLKNVAGKPKRGSQTAAAFLWEFLFPPGTPEDVINADKTEVVHIDMARVCTGTSSAQADGIPLHGALWWHLAAHFVEFETEPEVDTDTHMD